MPIVDTTITDFNNKIADISRRIIEAKQEQDVWINGYRNSGGSADIVTGPSGQPTLLCVGKPNQLVFMLCNDKKKQLDALGQKIINLDREKTELVNNLSIALQAQGFTPDVAEQTANQAYQDASALVTAQAQNQLASAQLSLADAAVANFQKYWPYIIAIAVAVAIFTYIYFKYGRKAK
jgi:hypothetical protein